MSDIRRMPRMAGSVGRSGVAIAVAAAVAAGCLGGYHQPRQERRSETKAAAPAQATPRATASYGYRGRAWKMRSEHGGAGKTPTNGAPDERQSSTRESQSTGQMSPGRRTRGLARLGQPAVRQPWPVDCVNHKCVALTFDDGPGPHTERLLDVLARRRVPATFFLLGMNAERDPTTVERIGRDGHELANHSYDHAELAELSPAEIRTQLARTQQAIYAASGIWPCLMRPPYGATNKRVARVARTLRLPQVLWSLDTEDWDVKKAATVVDRATRATRRGEIILLHDIHKSSVDAVPGIITRLQRQGFRFVTVSGLSTQHPFLPGQSYMGPVPP